MANERTINYARSSVRVQIIARQLCIVLKYTLKDLVPELLLMRTHARVK